MSIEAMKRIKSFLQDTKMIDSHTISAVVAECDMAILAKQPATGEPVAWSDTQIDRLLGVKVPGGSDALHWFLPYANDRGLSNIRDVVRLMLAAANAHPAPSGLGDSKRLDYLQDRGATIDLTAGVAAFYPMRFRVGGLHSSANIDVRAAIDAAMLAAKAGGA